MVIATAESGRVSNFTSEASSMSRRRNRSLSCIGTLLPLINSGAVEILDNERLIAQLVSLERRTARGGKESIDHAPGAHDDVANAVAGALVTAYKEPGISNFKWPLN
jgi:hypothetical protein